MDFRWIEIMFKKGGKSLYYPRIHVICNLMHNSCSNPDITLSQSDSLLYKKEYLENAKCYMKSSSIYILSGKIIRKKKFLSRSLLNHTPDHVRKGKIIIVPA